MATRGTKIRVRVQAKGGKFLGDDIGGALVTLRDGQTGEILATGMTSGDSGSVVGDYSPDASQRAIVTPGRNPPYQWLLAAETTSRFDATLALERPTLLEVSAFGAVGGLQAAHPGSYEVRHAGFYEATFTAIQKSTGNTGAGQVTFFYQAPTE